MERKYIKTFESFQGNFDSTDLNEGFLWGEGSIWSKTQKWFSAWKNKEMHKGAELINKALEKNPKKLEEFISKTKPLINKISDQDKNEILSTLEKFKGSEPPKDVVDAAKAIARAHENLKDLEEGTKIYESYSLLLEKVEDDFSKKIIDWLGLSIRAVAFIQFITACTMYIYSVLTGVILANPFVLLGAIAGAVPIALVGYAISYNSGRAGAKD